MKEFRYYTNCVDCEDGDAINKMKDGATQVTLQTMRRRVVDFNEVVKCLGYDRSFPISKD